MSSLNTFKTPILLMVYNRPELTRLTLQSLQALKPPVVYIACDGPSPDRHQDLDKVEQTCREIVDAIGEVSQLIWRKSSHHQGCRRGCSSAITWFFTQVEAGIILEDDCRPRLSFFYFCQELLGRYENDERIWQISGHNAIAPIQIYNDYYFSNYGSIWGWATWRNRWQYYDGEFTLLDLNLAEQKMKKIFFKPEEVQFRLDNIKKIKNGYDTWDIQWAYAKHAHKGMSIVPRINMIQNIGFGQDATHTISTKDLRSKQTSAEMDFPLKHTKIIAIDRELDEQFFSSLNIKNSRLKQLLRWFLPQWK